MDDKKSFGSDLEKFDLICLIFASFAVFAMLLWILKYSYLGLDFTDESFYLTWISNPSLYKISLSQFGFIYHPLYTLVGGNIALLRQCNVALSFGLAWLFCLMLFKSKHGAPVFARSGWFVITTISAMLASTVLAFFRQWIAVPSYNSLSLQALLIAATGLILIDKKISFSSVVGWMAVGFSGWLCFMAKPSTALALLIVVLIYLYFTKIFNLFLVALAALTAGSLIFITALTIDGSLISFIGRLKMGMESGRLMGAGHTLSSIFRLDHLSIVRREKIAIIFWILLGTILGLLGSSAKIKLNRIGLFISTCFLVACALITIFDFTSIKITPSPSLGLQLSGIYIAFIITATSIHWRQLFSAASIKRLLFSLFFAIFPFVFAFGTALNYWNASSGAAFFWVVAGCILLVKLNTKSISWRSVFPLAALGQFITIILMATGFEHPYRQPMPLSRNPHLIQIGVGGGNLKFSDVYASYVKGLKRITKEAGFKPGDGMIDMTGRSPGALFTIGAISVGQPWMIGGYPGSNDRALFALAKFSCDTIASAWIITEPFGERNLDTSILEKFGVNLSESYLLVGALSAPGSDTAENFEQKIFKPVKNKEKTIAACKTFLAVNSN